MKQMVVKDTKLKTGGVIVVILSEKDAADMDVHNSDRIKICYKSREVNAIVDIYSGNVKPGIIGMVYELLDALKVKNGDIVKVMPSKRPLSLHYIKRKLDGHRLKKKEIKTIIQDIAYNNLSDIEITYFVSASYIYGLNRQETIDLTQSMVETGEFLNLKSKQIVDLHSIGGVVGNRTTMIVVPIIAAAKLYMPKTSSRSITSPAGTADTMEVLCKVKFSIKEMRDIVKTNYGCIIWGGALNLAPTDDRFIRIEHPLSIDAEGQMLASIMAKKLSVSSTHLLIDIPYGDGSKVSTRKEAQHLKKKFEYIGKTANIKVKVVLTDGSQPIGSGFGCSLEAIDCLNVLMNKEGCPKDLKDKSVWLSGLIFEMVGKAKRGQGEKLAKEILESGKAYDSMLKIIKAQGGKKPDVNKIKPGKFKTNIHANRSGKLRKISNRRISRIARIAGAPADFGAGIYIYNHVGDKVKKGEVIFTIYSNSKTMLRYAADYYRKVKGTIQIR